MSRPNEASAIRDGLVVEQVSHAFAGHEVVKAASLSVLPGQVHCLLGPSGSGKTTLLRIVAGLEQLQQGRIEIAGAEVASDSNHVPPESRPIGFVFQDYALFPHLNIRDNVTFGMSGQNATTRRERAAQLLDQVGMTDFQKAMPHTLSGGQQQRVALARALARKPKLMLLDEPFSGLDVRLRDDVRGQTLEVLKEKGVATLMVTHDPFEAMMVADEISVIHDGRIEQTDSPQAIYAKPANERVAESLGEINCLDSKHPAVLSALAGAEHASQDRQTVALIRPEWIELTFQQDATSVQAVVVSARHVGANVRVTVKLSTDQKLTVLAEANTKVAVGETVHVRSKTPPHVVSELS